MSIRTTHNTNLPLPKHTYYTHRYVTPGRRLTVEQQAREGAERTQLGKVIVSPFLSKSVMPLFSFFRPRTKCSKRCWVITSRRKQASKKNWSTDVLRALSGVHCLCALSAPKAFCGIYNISFVFLSRAFVQFYVSFAGMEEESTGVQAHTTGANYITIFYIQIVILIVNLVFCLRRKGSKTVCEFSSTKVTRTPWKFLWTLLPFQKEI